MRPVSRQPGPLGPRRRTRGGSRGLVTDGSKCMFVAMVTWLSALLHPMPHC